jgi:hypothetical protein
MEVIRVPDRPASPRLYAVAGRLLFVESSDLRFDVLIERLFAGWQLTPVPDTGQAPDIRISFRCGLTPPEIPRNIDQFEIAEGGKCFTDGANYYLAVGDALLRLENGSPVTVSLWFSELPVADDPLPARMGSFAVCASLRRFGLFELHSAGLVQPETESGVLVIGPSGSGKSTLALQLVLAGWPYLSDDEVLLSLVDGQVEARGFRNFFAVTSATASALGMREQDVSGRLKTCFEPNVVLGSAPGITAVPRALFFTSVSGEEKTQLNKLTPAETMTRLIRACPWATYDTAIASANLNVLSRLAQQTSAFDLIAGRDLLKPDCAPALLSRYVGA